jgi:hypothetical protein
MNTGTIEIRRVTPDATDVAAYREIRLEALQQSPEAFGSTFEVESAQPLDWFSDRLTNGRYYDNVLMAKQLRPKTN